ncbi:FG-GAP repeat domain-containing protein [Spirosoma rhododendri]|uniref:VCBS repeat-containing protein n=1 Tax=Spirosoma rhododendri TaxID=2728024 RepID=A0A7L5DM68_9BACT|nr:VCBS repeat-containing protein [Spirosoma rhododendri]QJD79215.1 VCBS repeat-containing protein [Spirosoma rhododendri]
MKGSTYILITLAAFLTVGFLSFRSHPASSGKQLADTYCGTCHLVPDPKSLTKFTWQLHVLPVMARYMGIQYGNYDPYSNLTTDETDALAQQHIYPDKPVVDEATWQQLVDYYTETAPTRLPVDSSRAQRDHALDQFTVVPVQLSNEPGATVTALHYDSLNQQLWVAEPNKLYSWKWPATLVNNYNLPATVVDIHTSAGQLLLTDIGTLLPSNLPKGTVFSIQNDKLVAQQGQLHRPVYSQTDDLDNDGIPELITASFGYHTGSLSLYRQRSRTDSTRTKQIIFDAPGAVKFYVRDMNGDHKKDIVALFAQNLESVYIFFQGDNLTFTAKKVLQFEPQYGTSDFVLLDYNRDGIDDIALVHGDNADYSYSSKAFHGLRLYLGNRDQTFTSAFFYPIYGATRLQADDFDQDGDIDFAVSSFFPELSTLAAESFVYLENKKADRYRFVAHVAQTPVPIKSLTLEKMDIDRDGDMDLVLGQVSYSPTPMPTTLRQALQTTPYKLILLRNRHTN